MIIDCDTCIVRGAACGDCVITVLLRTPRLVADRSVDDSERAHDCAESTSQVDLDPDEQRAVVALASFGLVPPLRLVDPRTPSGPDSIDGTSGRPVDRNRQHIA